jgi:TRAP-type C4-dicarboxylate transport system permease small subunit
MTATIKQQSGEDTPPPSAGSRLHIVLDKIGSTLEICSGAISVLLLMLMTAIVLLGVVFRYIIGDPLQWSEELARFLMLWGSFLAINVALRKNQHIRIDIILKKMPPFLHGVVGLLIDVLSGCFLIILAIKGYDMATGSFMKAMSMDFSMFWILLSVPIGALLTLVQLILGVFQNILTGFTPPAP